MKKEASNIYGCQDVRMTSVDSFQGEENDIILLSLVRSNGNGDIGFVKVHNRVCLALSRSRIGLYIIGNRTCLSAKSELWRQVLIEMKQKGKLGKALKLSCQHHLDDKGIMAMTSEDFETRPEGGCDKLCVEPLKCGHPCGRICHATNRDHKDTKCNDLSHKIHRNGPQSEKKNLGSYPSNVSHEQSIVQIQTCLIHIKGSMSCLENDKKGNF
jgi:hypothetical protein